MFDGIVNVKWFGAIGDDTNDDTDAIQSTLDFISLTTDTLITDYKNYGGGTVFLPKGVYKITDTLLMGENCRLIGVNDRMQNFYDPVYKNGGSVIKSHFQDNNRWIISSATFKYAGAPPPPLVLLSYDEALSKNKGTLNGFDKYTFRMGINIENLTIDGSNVAFGGIRLSNAGN